MLYRRLGQVFSEVADDPGDSIQAIQASGRRDSQQLPATGIIRSRGPSRERIGSAHQARSA